MPKKRLVTLALTGALLAACGSDSKPSCDPAAQTGCALPQVCEKVENGAAPACFLPVVLQGKVTDLATHGAIAGARLVALDANRAPVTTVATSIADGSYALTVPAERKADGTPLSAMVTLRADAKDYQSFPAGVRTALPIDVSAATRVTDKYVLQSSQTDVGLIALPAAARASVHGSVAAAPGHVGALVVAEPSGGGQGVTGVTDASGSYAIFNLPVSGSPYTIQAYAPGANYTAVTQAVAAGDDPVVNLALRDTSTATVAGSVQFTGQNVPANATTSVILVVKSTFDPTLARGEAPPGLRVAGITSGYSIPGVPDGSYIVLAAFENDGMVRDVSGIGGTALVGADVSNGAVTSAPTTFKITGAISLAAPFVAPYDTAPYPVTTATPTFSWSAYPSTNSYEVSIVDSLGTVVVPTTSVSKATTSFTYPGTTALRSGMYYQLKVVAIGTVSSQPAQISQTEDLEGVFYVP